jgi:hypothetical protein
MKVKKIPFNQNLMVFKPASPLGFAFISYRPEDANIFAIARYYCF